MSDEFGDEPKSEAERRILLWALLLNAGLSAALAIGGFIADSSALIANAVDNASDAAVYAISFMAVKRGARWKRAAARVSGVMLLGVALGVMADVIRRVVGDPQPVGSAIMVMAIVAAIVNMVCLRLLSAIARTTSIFAPPGPSASTT